MVVLQHRHVVDFYSERHALAERVATYLREGFAHGEPALVIATPEHRALFAARLAAEGVDVARCRRDGIWREHDAQGLLDEVLVAGALDPERFAARVGALVRALPGARVVGELVDLLWARRDLAGALALEQAWSALAAEASFSLYCCYGAAESGGLTEGAAALAALHAGVASPGTTRTRRFVASVTAPRAARVFVGELLARSGVRPETIEVASVIVSELASNAVLHAGTDFAVTVSRTAGGLWLAVSDESAREPTVRTPAPHEPRGRGLALVATFARDWGVDRTPPGKTVWAELALAEN